MIEMNITCITIILLHQSSECLLLDESLSSIGIVTKLNEFNQTHSDLIEKCNWKNSIFNLTVVWN